jgi:hypothetical protein
MNATTQRLVIRVLEKFYKKAVVTVLPNELGSVVDLAVITTSVGDS